MKQVSEMPTSGQFVAVWSLNGAPWSAAYKSETMCCKWESGRLNVYSIFDDEWEKVEHPASLKNHLSINNASYYVAD